MSDVFGVIAPHPPIMLEEVGGERAGVTRRSTEALTEAANALARFGPDLVVVLSPHAPDLLDGFAVDSSALLSGSLAQFGAPNATFSYRGDPRFAGRLLHRLDERGLFAVDRMAMPALHPGVLDHGVIVPMSYLDPDGRWPIVVLSLSHLPFANHRALGEEVAATARELGLRLAFVASGDCSHRLTPDAPAGHSPRGAEFDRLLTDSIAASDFDALSRLDPELIEAAGECGLRSFIALGGATAPARARVLSYEGPWGVGYLTALVNEHLAADAPKGTRIHEPGVVHHPLVDLARDAIERFVTRHEVLDPAPLVDPSLPARAGTFVSLHSGGRLRGCIGTILATQDDLAHEIVHNAIQAATADPRFPALTSDELDTLDIKVDVLHAPEDCSSSDLDPERYGVIVSCGTRRGLLLPDLRGVDTPEQQVDIACRKAGISAEEPLTLERFRVDRYS